MDCGINVAQVVDVVFDPAELFRVGEQTLHLGLRAAISELEVVKHGVVLFCEALVCCLQGADVGAHLGGVVRHVHDCNIRSLDRLLRITAEALFQSSAEADGLLGVGVRRDASFCGFFCEGFRLSGCLAVDRLQAAEALFKRAARFKGVLEDFPDSCDGKNLFQPAQHSRSGLAAGCAACACSGAS